MNNYPSQGTGATTGSDHSEQRQRLHATSACLIFTSAGTGLDEPSGQHSGSAPWASNVWASCAQPRMAATCSAVWPSAPGAFGSAPCSRRNVTTAGYSVTAAAQSGVSPALQPHASFTGAPAATNSCTIALSPRSAARIKGVAWRAYGILARCASPSCQLSCWRTSSGRRAKSAATAAASPRRMARNRATWSDRGSHPPVPSAVSVVCTMRSSSRR